MVRYKLTTEDMKTRKDCRNEVTWEVGKWVEATGDMETNGLCSNAYIHWYTNPLLAVFLNPAHAAIQYPRLWEIETDGNELMDRELKGGSRRVKLVREIPLPAVTLQQRIRFAILCAKQVCTDVGWVEWADAWLSGVDRTRDSAVKAMRKAASVVSLHAAYAAAMATHSAHAAANIAAEAVTEAALAAHAAGAGFDLVPLAEEAIKGD